MTASISPHTPTRRFTSHAGSCTVYCNGTIMRAYSRNEITVVHITGEVDATNVDRVYEYGNRFASDAVGLIINLNEVDFLCARGIFALYALGHKCLTEGRSWVVVTSPAVDRLLRVCDPNHTIPTATSERQALISITAQSHGVLEAS